MALSLTLIILLISNSHSISGRETSAYSGWSASQSQTRPDVDDNNGNVNWHHPHYPEALRYLAKTEFLVYELMKGTAMELRTRLMEVEGWIQDFEDSSMKVRGTLASHLTNEDEERVLEEISGHPLMGLRMIRRYSGLKGILSGRNEKEQELKSLISEVESKSGGYGRPLPSKDDYDHAMDLVIHLQDSEGLNSTDLINGKIGPIQTSVGLTPFQGRELALRAEVTGNFTSATFWLRALLELDRNSNPTIDDELHAQLELDADRVAQKHSELLSNVNDTNFWDNLHRFWITDENEDEGSDWPNETLKQSFAQSENFWTYPKPLEEVIQLRSDLLCSGRGPSIPKLVCFTESDRNPYWLIAPLKIEVHSWDPPVVQVHDVVRDKKLAYLRAISTSKLVGADTESIKRVRVNTLGLGHFQVGTFSFAHNSTPELRSLIQHIGLVTGLEVGTTPEAETAGAFAVEEVRISSYGYGGFVWPHSDSPPKSVPLNVGDRIATFMIYLNEVRHGGGTVFPLIGAIAQPVKGSALLWYNLHRNGTIDERTHHAACPVVLGEKWIANIWIRSVASFRKRPCSLNQYE